MAIVSVTPESRVLLSNVSWSTFEALLAETDDRGTRFIFDQGYLEIMSPSTEHEWFHKLLGRMIEMLTLELNIPIRSGGASTLRDQMKQRGVEPDECYYIANEPRVRGREEIDLATDPPPDLAIEVEISRGSLDKLAIYGDLGVPEVWFYDGTALRVYWRQADGSYARQSAGRAFPFLPVAVLEGFLARRNESDETTWIRSFRDWVRGRAQG